jgi:cobaltochelatase CobS
MDTIAKLESIIANPETPDAMREEAQKSLDAEKARLASVGSAKVQLAAEMGTDDPQLAGLVQVFQTLQDALSRGGGSMSEKEFREAFNRELEIRKIRIDDLDIALRNLIASTRKVEFTVLQMSGVKTTSALSNQELEGELFQNILSDVAAKNNVYLYGGAGTGKTYISEKMAKALGWELVTINCNQYTSPLDILGGQTTEGYQEGRLIQAWTNLIRLPDGTEVKKEGCVLLLDELPKIDPNAAGLLNDALAKIKDADPTISNGKGIRKPKGSIFVIATGNVPLNTVDPDYEANFKQDLSLQDRFVGSTYKVFVNYENEFKSIMKGFAFIWIFSTKLRQAIKDTKGASSQGFVSIRLMQSLRDTYRVYRNAMAMMPKNVQLSPGALIKPKTLIDAYDSFFALFKPATREAILKIVDYPSFKNIVAEKNKMKYNESDPDFDTPDEIKEANSMIAKYNKERKDNPYGD